MKTAAIFPGQASQFIGMYKSMYEKYPLFRSTIREAEKVTEIPLTRYCFEGPLSQLSRAETAHAAILAFSVAAFRVYIEQSGIEPAFCAGHSLGEYAALVCAGALKFSDALELIQVRCKIAEDISERRKGGMSIIDGIETSKVQQQCYEYRKQGKLVYPACINTPLQTTVSGVQSDLIMLEQEFVAAGGKTTPLMNSAPFHSPIMDDADMMNKYRDYIQNIEFSDFAYPVLSNYTGRTYQSKEEIVSNMLNHLIRPVQWVHNMKYLIGKGVDYFIDFSARNVFSIMFEQYGIENKICFGMEDERENFIESKAKSQSDIIKDFVQQCILLSVSTPNACDNSEQFRCVFDNGMVILKEMYSKVDVINKRDLAGKCISAVKEILCAKKLECAEQYLYCSKLSSKIGLLYETSDIT